LSPPPKKPYRRFRAHGRATSAPGDGLAALRELNEVVPRHWWENLLHNQSSLRLKLRLFGRRNTIVVDVPYHLD
jgi:hypothetical protein